MEQPHIQIMEGLFVFILNSIVSDQKPRAVCQTEVNCEKRNIIIYSPACRHNLCILIVHPQYVFCTSCKYHEKTTSGKIKDIFDQKIGKFVGESGNCSPEFILDHKGLLPENKKSKVAAGYDCCSYRFVKKYECL